MSSPSAIIEEVRECDDDDDDDDFTLTRSFDKFETASEMNEMYDIMISDMSEKEQTEALNIPYRKKKPEESASDDAKKKHRRRSESIRRKRRKRRRTRTTRRRIRRRRRRRGNADGRHVSFQCTRSPGTIARVLRRRYRNDAHFRF